AGASTAHPMKSILRIVGSIPFFPACETPRSAGLFIVRPALERTTRLSPDGDAHLVQRCAAGGGGLGWRRAGGALLPRTALFAADVGPADLRAPPAVPVHRLRPSRAGPERRAAHRAGHGHAHRGRGGADPRARNRARAL